MKLCALAFVAPLLLASAGARALEPPHWDPPSSDEIFKLPPPPRDLADELPLTPGKRIIGGAVLLALGAVVAASSSALFVEAGGASMRDLRVLEYAMGAAVGAAGGAMTIAGGVILRRGIEQRHAEEEMGLAVGPGGFRLVF